MQNLHQCESPFFCPWCCTNTSRWCGCLPADDTFRRLVPCSFLHHSCCSFPLSPSWLALFLPLNPFLVIDFADVHGIDLALPHDPNNDPLFFVQLFRTPCPSGSAEQSWVSDWTSLTSGTRQKRAVPEDFCVGPLIIHRAPNIKRKAEKKRESSVQLSQPRPAASTECRTQSTSGRARTA